MIMKSEQTPKYDNDFDWEKYDKLEVVFNILRVAIGTGVLASLISIAGSLAELALKLS